jgi:hypothetical protein
MGEGVNVTSLVLNYPRGFRVSIPSTHFGSGIAFPGVCNGLQSPIFHKPDASHCSSLVSKEHRNVGTEFLKFFEEGGELGR